MTTKRNLDNGRRWPGTAKTSGPVYISYSPFVDSLSHYLPFQLLGPRRAIGEIMRTATSKAVPTDAI
jgi:hypothetical protein